MHSKAVPDNYESFLIQQAILSAFISELCTFLLFLNKYLEFQCLGHMKNVWLYREHLLGTASIISNISPCISQLEYFHSLPSLSPCSLCSAVQLCATHCKPLVCNLPGFSAHRIFQAWILEWVAISSSRRSSRPRDWIYVSCFWHMGSLPLSHREANCQGR